MAWTHKVAFLLLIFAAGCNVHRDKPGNGSSLTQVQLGSTGKVGFAQVQQAVFGPRCVSCHGSAGGVNLESYAEVKRNLALIEKTALQEKSMPKGSALSAQEAALLSAWIQAGAPENVSDTGATTTAPAPVVVAPVPPTEIDPAPAAPEALRPNFYSIRNMIFNNRCIGCHSKGNSAWSIPLDNYDRIIDSSYSIVIPGHTKDSRILDTITTKGFLKMPPDGPRLTDEEVAVIRKWIEIGAPEKDATTPDIKEDPDHPSFSMVKNHVLAPRCIMCHGAGKSIDLRDYNSVKKLGSQILYVALVDKTMPPDWPLPKSDAKLLEKWLKIGMPSDKGHVAGTSPSFETIKTNILVPRCVSCHGGTDPVGGISFDTKENTLKVLTPGKPDRSLLIDAISRKGADRMPPPTSTSTGLSDDEIQEIRDWINAGAK